MTGGGRDDGGRQGRRREARTTGRGRDDGEFGDGGECGYDGERQGQKEKLEDGERRTRVHKEWRKRVTAGFMHAYAVICSRRRHACRLRHSCEGRNLNARCYL